MVRGARVVGKATMSPTFKKATKKNKEGFPSFERSIEEQTLAVLMNGTLSNTFYVSAKKLAEELIDVLTQMCKKDPEFAAKALVYARTRGLMKLAPTTALAVLSEHDNADKKVNFRRVFHHVVKTPDDLREFVALVRTGSIRTGLGGEARDAVKRWLQHLSTYHAVKYGSAASKDITLRDILRMSHPRPTNDEQNATFRWLVKGYEDEQADKLPAQIAALESLKRVEGEEAAIELVTNHKLPWEVVVPSVKKMTTGIWKALLKDMPYMALLRNLNTMARNDVFKDKDTLKEVADRLSNEDNVAKSRQFPFRFYNAFHAFDGPQKIKDALVDALEASFKNVPDLPGRVAISNDVSGSMMGSASDRGTARYCDIAGLFAATFFKRCDDVILLPADSAIMKVNVSRRSTILDIAKKIGVARGGTDLAVPIRHLLDTKDKVDTYIGITDGEDWGAAYNGGFLTQWEKYKRTVAPKAKAFLITISPYRDDLAPDKYPDVHFIRGWSDSVLRYIPSVIKGGAGQVDDVRAIDLDNLNKK